MTLNRMGLGDGFERTREKGSRNGGKARSLIAGFIVLLAVLVALPACALDNSRSEEDSAGEVSAEIQTVPSGVQCIRISAIGAKTTRKLFPVTIGQSTMKLNLGRLAEGPQTLSGEAYDIACPASGNAVGPDPTWLADPVDIEVHAGAVTAVTLLFRQVNNTTPDVDFQPTVVQIAVGQYASFALVADGSVYYWGQFGHLIASIKPVKLAGFVNITQIAAGGDHLCAIDTNGGVFCAGDDWMDGNVSSGGVLGTGGTGSTVTPVQVGGFDAPAIQVTAAASHTCVRTMSTGVFCWGPNDYTPISLDEAVQVFSTPVRPSWAGQGAGVDIASRDLCIISGYGDGTVQCAGPNTGIGAMVTHESHASIDVSVGGAGGCARRANGAVFCWGDPGVAYPGTEPAPWVLQGATSISHGHRFACGVVTGSVVCWGSNSWGALGDGSGEDSADGVLALGLANVTMVATSNDWTSSGACALRADGAVFCWGHNASGQVGDGTYDARFAPARVRF